jgi:putative ABC transport system ATP-binding protein
MEQTLTPPATVATDSHEGPAVASQDLTRHYGAGDSAVYALGGVSIEVPPGQFAAVMGPSGSGKSTLMHLLAGLDEPTTGQVWIGGEEITSMNDDQLTMLRRRRLGFIFQFFNLLPMLSAEDNIGLPMSIAGNAPDPSWMDEVIETVGLTDRRRHRPSELSGGQQQRVAVARALLSRPTILFADEPTGNLDSTTSEEVLQVMRDSVDSYGQTTLMVTHDATAAAVADRVVFLADGVVVKDAYGLSESDVLAAMEELRRR